MKGFTLTETLVSIFVFSLLTGALFLSIFSIYKTHSYQWQQAIAISEARKGIETMVKEIREAREGENGTYPIEYAGEKEFIFFADVDDDGKAERVRYFLGKIEEKFHTQECQSNAKGGSCSAFFSDFFRGNLKEAKLTVSVQGDLGRTSEYIDIFVDGQQIGTLCKLSCSKCPGTWQGTQTFDVLSFALDNSISILAQASSAVDPSCPFSFKAKFDLLIKEEIQTTELKRGIIKPVGDPPTYPPDQEKVSILTSFVRNAPPIFEYFDEKGNKIEDYPARLINTKLMKIFLVINVDPKRPPEEFQLQSFVTLRNLKKE